jgi:threonine/homoserine/homoserine lactone efflux protein
MIPSSAALLLFVSAALLLLVIPGPAVFYIVGRSIGYGRSAGLVSALGIAVGSIVHTAAAAVGLSALLSYLEFVSDADGDAECSVLLFPSPARNCT